MITYTLIGFCFLRENLRGHSYDGGNNISGRYNDVHRTLSRQV